VFDAGRLKGILEELGGQLEPVGQDARLKHVQNTRTLEVEGGQTRFRPIRASVPLTPLRRAEGSL